MSLKTLRAFSSDSNAFEARFEALRSGDADPTQTSALVDELLGWLRTCVAHGRYLPALSADREALQAIVDYWTSRLLRLGRALPDDLERLADHDATAGIPLLAACPYPGLEPYTDKQRGRFFGREELVAGYIAHLEDPAKRILLIIGASGSGKSSLVLAGLLPRLHDVHGDQWLFAPRMTPGDHPVAALASAVAQAIGQPALASDIGGSLASNPSAALAALASACGARPLLVLVDQLEELFTLCRDTEEQKTFGEVLCALSDPSAVAGDFACRVLLTLRTDHLARFESNDALRPLHTRLLGQGNERHLTAVGFLEIKRAIAEPAKQVGLRFCPSALVDQLASQTAELANGLPLLQFALRRLWDTRPKNAEGEPLDLVTEEMVNALPDVQRALGTVADGIFREFTPQQKKICERLLQELVVLDENFEEPLRRRRYETELTGVLTSRLGASAEDVDAVVGRFVGAGLLRRFGEGSRGQIEVAHEALLRHWEHINRLVTGERVKAQLHLIKQVGREAAEWVSRGRIDGYLYLRGDRLERALEFARDGWLAEAESTQYVEACQARETAERLRQAQVLEAKLRAEEREKAAEKAAERAALDKAEAEKREAEAREREAIGQAKTRTAQLWLGLAFGTLLVVGLLAWNTIAGQRADLRNRLAQASANLNAFSTLAARLPPWEGLDVAYSLAQRLGPEGRLPLAHALERMEGAWLPGEPRSAELVPNRDGSALVQIDRTPGREAMRVYPIVENDRPGSASFHMPGKAIAVDLSNRGASLLSAQVGPPIDRHAKDRLAVLQFHDTSADSYVVEARRLVATSSPGGAADPAVSITLRPGQVPTGVNFDAEGAKAVFAAVHDGKGSAIYRVSLAAPGKTEILEFPEDPAGPGASPASAVAFGSSRPDTGTFLITARQDGSVFCGAKKLVPTGTDKPSAGPARQLVSLPGSDLFAMVDSEGDVFAWGCGGTEMRKFRRDEGEISGLTLSSVKGDQGTTTLLGFLVDNQPRCFAFAERGKERRWSFRRCNSVRLVAARVPLPRGEQLTVDLGHVAAVQIYPTEMDAIQDLRYEARHAGPTLVRWESPASAAKQLGRSVAADGDTSEAGPAAGGDLPWRHSRKNTSEWVADSRSALVVFAALSRDGKRLAWLEDRPDEAQIVVRTWTIGSGTSAQRPAQSGRAVGVAIANDGTLAHAQVSTGPPVDLLIGGARIDSLGALERTACLAFSPDGTWLVAGTTPGGQVRAYKIARESTAGVATAAAAGSWETPFGATDDRGEHPPRPISACDIADDGAVVIGTDEGRVYLRRSRGVWLDLTERAAFRLAAPVQDVALDRSGQRVLALAEWQLSDCNRPGLPGQALRVWDVNPANAGWRTPISNVCLPNQAVVGVGDLTNQRGEPGVALVTARGIRWHACPGCARPDEPERAMLERLLESAKNSGAQLLDNETILNRYGLSF